MGRPSGPSYATFFGLPAASANTAAAPAIIPPPNLKAAPPTIRRSFALSHPETTTPEKSPMPQSNPPRKNSKSVSQKSPQKTAKNSLHESEKTAAQTRRESQSRQHSRK